MSALLSRQLLDAWEKKNLYFKQIDEIVSEGKEKKKENYGKVSVACLRSVQHFHENGWRRCSTDEPGQFSFFFSSYYVET